ncbi:MAG: NADPH:quinone reductase [Chitinivibrionales bacterium]|nr:NADPH:quinone reductase [Chitinivibrionales bacterium]
MHAIRVHEFGGPEVLKPENLDIPQPEKGQILVKIKAVGVNPVETYIRCGTHARRPKLPYTPGTDAAGVVEAIGMDVEPLRAGDRVYTSGSITGTYAEYALCAAADVHPLPPRLSFQQGAAIGIPYATAYRALFQKAHALPGEWVLIHGASGGVGVAAVQLASAAGLSIIATAGSLKGRELLDSQGAHKVLDHGSIDYREKIMNFTTLHGVDLILEMLANKNLGSDLKMLSPGGRIVVIGNRGPVEIDARDLMTREGAVYGMVLFNAQPAELQQIHAALNAGLSNGTLKPVIGREVSFYEVAAAHRAIMEPGAYGKMVLML